MDVPNVKDSRSGRGGGGYDDKGGGRASNIQEVSDTDWTPKEKEGWGRHGGGPSDGRMGGGGGRGGGFLKTTTTTLVYTA